ncbi:UBN2 domain-containing protein [Cucumis melo var. makuwa]|uniref:UBN2 domain-containing protein n=1 Tax=Cucumis melo var. makuwa TaxID=1194695 RepID=A0A5A7VFG6_CUCMM|nr:UBN2 domain-containing protein [Cucumis melo var. makuwa]TYJ96546.1 UBN2 domain-containing protein [Cucumis melo var. makuwa]
MRSLQSHELKWKLFDSTPLEKPFICNPSIEGDLVEEAVDVAIEVMDDPTLCYRHFQANCWSKKANSNQAESTLMHEQQENDQDLIFLTINVQETSTEEIWYLDSGCSNHMTRRNDIFISLDESHQNIVKTGDNKKLEVKGKGDILVKTKYEAK